MGENFFFYQQTSYRYDDRIAGENPTGDNATTNVSELANEYNVVASVDNYDYENLTNE